ETAIFASFLSSDRAAKSKAKRGEKRTVICCQDRIVARAERDGHSAAMRATHPILSLFTIVLVLILLLTSTRAAHAEEAAADTQQHSPSEQPEPNNETPKLSVKRWYGWQTLLADVGTIGASFVVSKAAGDGDE